MLQLCPTSCDLMNCSLPGSSVHGLLQAGILEWVATPSSRGSSWPSDQTQGSYSSCIAGGFFTPEPLRNPSLLYAEALFVIVKGEKTQQLPTSPSMERGLSKLWYSHTMEPSSCFKKNERQASKKAELIKAEILKWSLPKVGVWRKWGDIHQNVQKFQSCMLHKSWRSHGQHGDSSYCTVFLKFAESRALHHVEKYANMSITSHVITSSIMIITSHIHTKSSYWAPQIHTTLICQVYLSKAGGREWEVCLSKYLWCIVKLEKGKLQN